MALFKLNIPLLGSVILMAVGSLSMTGRCWRSPALHQFHSKLSGQKQITRGNQTKLTLKGAKKTRSDLLGAG
jgi:hypothetical protein